MVRPPYVTQWERPDFLMDLVIAIYQVAEVNNALSKRTRDAVAEYMLSRGHETGWDAIRMATLKKRGWDAPAHEALLLCLLDEIKPAKAVLTKVTERMNQQGWPYSYDAINQHVQKLRKTRDTSCISAATADTPSNTPKKAVNGRKRTKKDAEEAEDDEEDTGFLKKEPVGEEEVFSPPPKRAAKRQKKANTAVNVKNEDAEF